MNSPQYAVSPSAGAKNVIEVFRRRVAEQPDKLVYTFLHDDEGQCSQRTFAQIDREARAIATRLRQLGLQGQRALLVYDPGIDFNAALVGCIYGGVIAVPAYPPDPMRSHRVLPRLQSIATNSQGTVLLTSSSLLEWAEGLFSRLSGIDTVVATDEIDPALADQWQEPHADHDTVAILQYTSGSTGTPRGVVIDHGNLIANMSQIHMLLHEESNVLSSWLPPYHDMGLVGHLLSWHSARHMVMLSPLAFFQRPIRWLRTFAEYGATCSAAPDFAYDHCIQKVTAEERRTLDLSNWQVALNGAEMIRPETLERFLEVFGPCGMRREAFYPSYGMAEGTVMVTGGERNVCYITKTVDLTALAENRVVEVEPGSANSRTFVGCGRAVPGTSVIVVDPDTLQRLPDGEVGEIWTIGPNVARGYWNDATATEERFRAFTADGEGPYLRTGDLGFLDRGELFVTGRIKDVIIVWGRNHYPQDIERTVEQVHPDLKRYGAAVFSVEIEGRERVVLVQEIRRPAKHDLPKLMETIRNEVAAEHQIPLDVIVLVKLGEIPKTSSGKIQRSIARELFLAGALDEVARWEGTFKSVRLPKAENYVAPRTETEAILAQVWQEALGVERVGIHDNFFDLGGHSLLATQLATRLAPYFQVEVPLRDMFERPTIAALAEYIDRALGKSSAAANIGTAPVPSVGAQPGHNGDAAAELNGDLEQLESLLRSIEGMSDQEAQQQLAQIDPTAAAEHHEYVILGAGPGGLQLGYFLEQAGRDYCILERDAQAGAFYKKFPRHRRLLSINKVYTGYEDPEVNLRWDWNSLLSEDHGLLFKDFSKEYFPPADALVEYLNEYADRYALNVRFNTSIRRISREGDLFRLQDDQGRVFTANVLIVATGTSLPYRPDVPGIELAEDYTEMTTDRDDFVGQRVLILGKGNAAFETANHLLDVAAQLHLLSPSPVRFASQTRYLGDLRAVNSHLLETCVLNQQNALLEGQLLKLQQRGDQIAATVKLASGETEELLYDRVLCCTGMKFDDDIFDDTCRPVMALNGRFPDQTAAWESTNVSNLFFAGTLMQMRDYRRTHSAFINGYRHNIHLLHRILQQRYHGVPLPAVEIECAPEAIAKRLAQRAATGSGLWQQAGYLCDAVVIRPGGQPLYYEDLTVDYVLASELGRNGHYYLLTMEYGQESPEMQAGLLTMSRNGDVDRAELSTGIHPVLRRYNQSTIVAEWHGAADADGEFNAPAHVESQLRFLRKQLGAAGAAKTPAVDPT